MVRTICQLLVCVGVLFCVASCGDDDADQAAEALAEIENVRAEYDARETNIESVFTQAMELRASKDVKDLAWGERPKANFPDTLKELVLREFNGRIYQVGDDGAINTDPETMFGLSAKTRWRDDMKKAMSAEGHLTAGMVKGRFEAYQKIRYLCLLVEDKYVEPIVGVPNLSTVKFTAGIWSGRALYFDLTDATFLGAKVIEVRNHKNIDFKYNVNKSSDTSDEIKKRALSVAKLNLRAQVIAIAIEA